MQNSHTDPSEQQRTARPWALRIMQALMHRWFLLSRAMTLGVRGVVLDGDDRILLVEHTYVPGWHLPGGGVEIGETVTEALAKELHEEAGVTITGEIRLHGVFHNGRVSQRDHVVVYIVRDFSWNGPPAPNREIKAASFFARTSLPTTTSAATRRRLAEVLDDVPPLATW